MTGISTLGQALNRADRITEQQRLFDSLATQLSTGKKTQRFAGLGNDVLTSKRARADFSSLNIYIQNLTNGDRRINLANSAINEIKSQTETLSGALTLFSQESAHQQGDIIFFDDPVTITINENQQLGYTSAEPDVDFQNLIDLADSIFDIVADLLNFQDGENYLLNGADVGTRPLGDTGTLDSALSNLIQDWKDGTISNEDLIADLTSGDTTNNSDAITDTIIGFSANLSADNVGDTFVRASDTIEIETTVKANEDPFRDILVGLAFLKNPTLPPIADAFPPVGPNVDGAPGADVDEMKENFYTIYNSVVNMVESALDDIDNIVFRTESARARMDDVKESHIQTQNFLQNNIDDIENVNIDEVALQISTLQIQLEASYAVTAQVQQLSLVNFIR